MEGLALRLARWAGDFQPDPADLALAERSLTDTVSVALAAGDEAIVPVVGELSAAARWSVAAHILDFDDLHLPSTTHISTVCVPAALATGTGAEGYLVGAGVMARLGTALGHPHYARGWHATATSGALAAAAVASRALGLDVDQTAQALALAVSCTGGVQAAFGTDAKSLQVGFATDGGLRAAALVAQGASAALGALDEWVAMVGGDAAATWPEHPAVPGGLAIKLFPCCYALQRTIGAARAQVAMEAERDGPVTGLAEAVRRITVATPLSTVKPLIHHRPQTGLEGKFSLEYSIATGILDSYSGFASFTDQAVQRPEAQRLLQLVEVQTSPGGQGLLAGEVRLTIETAGGARTTQLTDPPGSTENPAGAAELNAKFASCLAGTGVMRADITWESAAALLEALWDRRSAPAA